MDEKYQTEVALFRYSILAPVISGTKDDSISDYAYFCNASTRTYEAPNGKQIHISATTMRRWHLLYLKYGFDGLKPQRRSDFNQSRKMDDDIKEQIKYLKKEYPRLPATMIHQKLQENGTIKYGEISLSTINRYVNRLMEENKETNKKDMRRYEREHINEVWCGDSSVGPYIKIGGKKMRTYVIALIDDASRYIVGIDIFINDNFVNLMSVIKSAVRKNGKPKVFNFDNGPNYKSTQMALLGARIGVSINYCAPYTPTSKAKIERWFKTMKDQWMSQLNMNDYKDLNELRESLYKYVQKYNQTVHHSLNGMTPQDRFFDESRMIIRLDEEYIENAFLLEIERTVSNDNVITIDHTEYEVHYRYAGRKLLLRYSPDLSKIYIVDKRTGELEELKLLDKHANANIKREKVKLSGGE